MFMFYSKFLMEKESKDYSKFMRWLAKDICNYMNDDFNDYDFMQNIVKILRNTDLIDELGINGVEFNPAKNDFKNFYAQFILNLDRKTLANINLEKYEDKSTDDYAVYRDDKNLVFGLFETKTFSVKDGIDYNSLFDSVFSKKVKDCIDGMPAEKINDFIEIWETLYLDFDIKQDIIIKKLVDLGVIGFSDKMITELKKFVSKARKGKI